jgi:hypothetical protein
MQYDIRLKSLSGKRHTKNGNSRRRVGDPQDAFWEQRPMNSAMQHRDVPSASV